MVVRPVLPTLDPAAFGPEEARHLLVRAGFGGTPEEVARMVALGLDAAVDELVEYERVPDPLPDHQVELPRYPALSSMRTMEREERRELQQAARRLDRQEFQRLRAWWLERMVASPRPLEEKLTLFWHGLFTSSYRDVRSASRMAQQNDLFRGNAAGNFRALLFGVARDPAMLQYLNNNQNIARAPNENFARELMELFVLGEGHYTEQDIKEAARAFTGWTFNRRTSGFLFRRSQHDFGEKEVLGVRGRLSGDDVLRILLKQDAASRHLAGRLLAWFAIAPEPEEVEPFAHLLRKHDWELKPMLHALFRSEWFYSDRVRGRQIKSPVELVVGMLRTMGIQRVPGRFLVRACDGQGHALMMPPNVKGWDGGAAWVTANSLVQRYNLCRVLVSAALRGRYAGETAFGAEPLDMDLTDGPMDMEPPPQPQNRRRRTRGDRFAVGAAVPPGSLRAGDAEAVVDALCERFLVLPIKQTRRDALVAFMEGTDGSEPWRPRSVRSSRDKLGALIHLITITPEFQIQ